MGGFERGELPMRATKEKREKRNGIIEVITVYKQ